MQKKEIAEKKISEKYRKEDVKTERELNDERERGSHDCF